MGLPADAALSARHWVSAATDVSRDTAGRNTCAHSENPVVVRWSVLGSVVLELAWLAMSGREESTFLLDDAFCMV